MRIYTICTYTIHIYVHVFVIHVHMCACTTYTCKCFCSAVHSKHSLGPRTKTYKAQGTKELKSKPKLDFCTWP